ncbi:PleD family two-component system response regulator [Candidatus Omnitrophota bacterium]
MEKKKVMVIDDEDGVLLVVKKILEDKYEVLTLLNAIEVIAQVGKFKPDVILLDILMPAIAGIEVCQMLNKDPIGKNIPIIILSALERTAVKLKELKPMVVDYCIKPIDMYELIAMIEKVLSERPSIIEKKE